MVWHVVTCACGHPAARQSGEINRAAKRGWPLWCSRACAGAAKRLANPPTETQRKAVKRLYDMEYRQRHAAKRKAQKAAYHKRTYDPTKAATERKAKMPRHVEYCRQPEYRAYKKEYDRRYRAKLDFGEFWESSLLLLDLQSEVLSRASRYEIDLMSNTLNKKQQRRRDYDSLVRG